MTVLLAFDTSTERMAVGVHARGSDRHADGAGGALASTALLPHISVLLAQAGAALADVDAIAFGRGPGAFTGLRASCAVAQGLGFGLGRPLLPIDSLLIVAEDARAQAGATEPFDVGVAMDARMDEVYAGRYAWSDGRWHTIEAPALCSLAVLARRWQEDPPAHVAGSALTAFGARLELAPASARWSVEHARAAALLRLAVAAHAAGAAVAAADALPLYLRDKVALTTVERAAARAGLR